MTRWLARPGHAAPRAPALVGLPHLRFSHEERARGACAIWCDVVRRSDPALRHQDDVVVTSSTRRHRRGQVRLEGLEVPRCSPRSGRRRAPAPDPALPRRGPRPARRAALPGPWSVRRAPVASSEHRRLHHRQSVRARDPRLVHLVRVDHEIRARGGGRPPRDASRVSRFPPKNFSSVSTEMQAAPAFS